MGLNLKKREGFSSKIGVVAAAAGSAIGLGNIWRFPYILGQGGGGAFLIVYIAFIMLIGLTCLLVAFVIGRRAQRDVIGAFGTLAPGKPWVVAGWIALITVILIFAFYSVVFGWTLDYVVKSLFNCFAGKSSAQIADIFRVATSKTTIPIVYTFIGIGLTILIVLAGVRKGIEKYAKILMPVLFVLLLVLVVRSLTLPNSYAGLQFLFKPDFSKLTTKVVLIALGQAFFTLSLGSGAMITYGSYIDKKEGLFTTALYTCSLDTGIALLAGIAIFPAVFAFGIAPGEGPGLAFITLPAIFQQMFGGYYFAIIFFLLMSIAALTSTIAMLEVVVASVTEGLKIKRKVATIWIGVVVALVSIPCSLSFGLMSNVKFFGHNFFEFLNYLTANFGMTISCLISAIFVGWFLGMDKVRDELSNRGLLKIKYFPVWRFLVRYVVPIAIIIVFLSGIGVL